jgi:hypothetical protein
MEKILKDLAFHHRKGREKGFWQGELLLEELDLEEVTFRFV